MGASPAWLEEKGKINEPLFCKEFSHNYPIIFSENRFYDYNGEVSEDIISHKISEIVMTNVTNNVAAVVKRLVEALKLCCFSKPIIPKEDEIHLLNGILKTDGTWLEDITTLQEFLGYCLIPSTKGQAMLFI